jgi:hypothetical protein
VHASSGGGIPASRSIHQAIESCISGCCCWSQTTAGLNVLPTWFPHAENPLAFIELCPGETSCAALPVCAGIGVVFPWVDSALNVLVSLGLLSINSGITLSISKLLSNSFSQRRMILATCCNKRCSTGPGMCVAVATSSCWIRWRRVRRKARDESEGEGEWDV